MSHMLVDSPFNHPLYSRLTSSEKAARRVYAEHTPVLPLFHFNVSLHGIHLNLIHSLVDWLPDIDLQFPFHSPHMYLPMLGDIGQQDAETEGHRQHALNGAAQGASSLRLTEAFFAQKIDGTIIGVQCQPLL